MGKCLWEGCKVFHPINSSQIFVKDFYKIRILHLVKWHFENHSAITRIPSPTFVILQFIVYTGTRWVWCESFVWLFYQKQTPYQSHDTSHRNGHLLTIKWEPSFLYLLISPSHPLPQQLMAHKHVRRLVGTVGNAPPPPTPTIFLNAPIDILFYIIFLEESQCTPTFEIGSTLMHTSNVLPH